MAKDSKGHGSNGKGGLGAISHGASDRIRRASPGMVPAYHKGKLVGYRTPEASKSIANRPKGKK